MGRAGWVWATEEVVVGLVGATLRGTVARARLLEAILLYLERQDLVYPFSESFLNELLTVERKIPTTDMI